MEIKSLLLKEKTSLIKEYCVYVQLNKKEMKDITLLTWTKLGLIPTIQHPISGHHLTLLQMPEKIPLIKDKDL
jgi:hypothetical protein